MSSITIQLQPSLKQRLETLLQAQGVTIEQAVQQYFEQLLQRSELPPLAPTVLETEAGPQISDSRVMVYDVLQAHDTGTSPAQIATTYNLSLEQVQVALSHIAQHRAVLETELAEIQQQQAVVERGYRQQVTAIRAKAQTLPMTPKRQKFFELLTASRHARGLTDDHRVE